MDGGGGPDFAAGDKGRPIQFAAIGGPIAVKVAVLRTDNHYGGRAAARIVRVGQRHLGQGRAANQRQRGPAGVGAQGSFPSRGAGRGGGGFGIEAVKFPVHAAHKDQAQRRADRRRPEYAAQALAAAQRRKSPRHPGDPGAEILQGADFNPIFVAIQVHPAQLPGQIAQVAVQGAGHIDAGRLPRRLGKVDGQRRPAPVFAAQVGGAGQQQQQGKQGQRQNPPAERPPEPGRRA